MPPNVFDQFDQPQATPGFVPLGAPDPSYANKGALSDAELAKERAQALTAAAAVPTAGAIANADLANKQGDAALAPGKLTAQQIANQNASIKLQEEQQAAAKAARANSPLVQNTTDALSLKTMGNTIQNAMGDIDKGYAAGNFFGTPGFGSVPYFGQNSADLAGALSTVKSNVFLDRLKQMKDASAGGSTGLGRITNVEATMIGNGLGSINQTQSPDVLKRNLADIYQHELRLQAAANGENPDDPAVARKYGIMAAGAPVFGTPGSSGGPPGAAGPGNGGGGPISGAGGPAGGPPDALGLSSNGYETQADPTLKGVNQHVRTLIGQGAKTADIVGYLNGISPGMGDARASDIANATAFRVQHPDTPLSQYRVSLENKYVPLSPIRSIVNAADQTAPGAAILGAADAVTGGYLDNLTSNPALARAGMAAAAADHPYASLGGQIAGGALAGAGLEGAIAPALSKLGIGATGALRAADATYGGFYGSGSNDDNRAVGAALGAGAGVLGGMFGRGITRAAGRSLSGIQDSGLQYLNKAGVPLTIGQTLGGTAKDIEDKATSIPLVGSLINGRRKAGLTAVQQAAFDQALAPIGASTDGAIATQGAQRGFDAVSDAYDKALSGKSVGIDQTYAQNMGIVPHPTGGPTVPAMVAAIPNRDVAREVGSSIRDTITPMIQGGRLSGKDYQAIDRGLEGLKSSYSNNPLFSTYIKPAIDAAGDQVDGLWNRQAPDVLDDYNNAKAAYRNMSILADANLKGQNNGFEFTPAQLGMSSRANTVRFSGRNAAATGKQPFTELQQAAQLNLPSKIPDSGTAGRYLLASGAAALGGGGGAAASEDGDRESHAAMGALALGALASAPYSRVAQTALTKTLLAERPQVVTAIGDQLLKRAKIGGMFGSPLALQRYVAPQQ